LIVDDSSVMRKIVERSLLQAGLEIGDVVEAGNGIEALAAVREGSFDLILSDINMPAMDGIEFLRHMNKMDVAKGTPVVMVTTEGSESRVVEALSIGARRYIRKPFTPDQIKERVSRSWRCCDESGVGLQRTEFRVSLLLHNPDYATVWRIISTVSKHYSNTSARAVVQVV
jgi:two-component system chemotaxis response regulator CheY